MKINGTCPLHISPFSALKHIISEIYINSDRRGKCPLLIDETRLGAVIYLAIEVRRPRCNSVALFCPSLFQLPFIVGRDEAMFQ